MRVRVRVGVEVGVRVRVRAGIGVGVRVRLRVGLTVRLSEGGGPRLQRALLLDHLAQAPDRHLLVVPGGDQQRGMGRR